MGFVDQVATTNVSVMIFRRLNVQKAIKYFDPDVKRWLHSWCFSVSQENFPN